MADSSQPYGDVAYADPGYQKDGKKRYPIDTEEHTKAAWSYINQGDNASAYSAEQLVSIKDKIRAAAKKFGIEIAEEQQEVGRSAFMSPFENGGVFARSMMPGPDLNEESERGSVLFGKLAVFDEWAEIRSKQEGHFIERISRGAFTKTLQNNRKVPVLFQHGEDPQLGGKPLGKISRLEETESGVEYEVELFDTDYVRSILPALRAGEFGSSFTFNPVKDKTTVRAFPQRSNYNPDRLAEITHHEVKMLEFGPGIMPYYAGATAGVRSATDEFLFGRFAGDRSRLRELLTIFAPDAIVPAETALSNERAEDEPHSGAESRNVPLVPVRKRFQTTQGWLAWCENVLK